MWRHDACNHKRVSDPTCSKAVGTVVTFDSTKTHDIQSLVWQWSGAPIAQLLDLLGPGYRYGYIPFIIKANRPALRSLPIH